jgi:hypothetical protein
MTIPKSAGTPLKRHWNVLQGDVVAPNRRGCDADYPHTKPCTPRVHVISRNYGQGALVTSTEDFDPSQQTVLGIAGIVRQGDQIWLAPVPGNNQEGAVMPHFAPGIPVVVTPADPEDGLEREDVVLKATNTHEFDLMVKAVRLDGPLADWVASAITGPAKPDPSSPGAG